MGIEPNAIYGPLWSPGDIVKRLHGVTARQILDLAEKGLITPSRETTGAGSPRLYDFRNVFEICVCLAIRGRIPAGTAALGLTRAIINFIHVTALKEAVKVKDPILGIPPSLEGPPPFDLLLIVCDDRQNYMYYGVSYGQTFGEILGSTKRYKPQNYCSYTIEVSALWSYLKGIF